MIIVVDRIVERSRLGRAGPGGAPVDELDAHLVAGIAFPHPLVFTETEESEERLLQVRHGRLTDTNPRDRGRLDNCDLYLRAQRSPQVRSGHPSSRTTTENHGSANLMIFHLNLTLFGYGPFGQPTMPFRTSTNVADVYASLTASSIIWLYPCPSRWVVPCLSPMSVRSTITPAASRSASWWSRRSGSLVRRWPRAACSLSPTRPQSGVDRPGGQRPPGLHDGPDRGPHSPAPDE